MFHRFFCVESCPFPGSTDRLIHTNNTKKRARHLQLLVGNAKWVNTGKTQATYKRTQTVSGTRLVQNHVFLCYLLLVTDKMQNVAKTQHSLVCSKSPVAVHLTGVNGFTLMPRFHQFLKNSAVKIIV